MQTTTVHAYLQGLIDTLPPKFPFENFIDELKKNWPDVLASRSIDFREEVSLAKKN